MHWNNFKFQELIIIERKLWIFMKLIIYIVTTQILILIWRIIIIITVTRKKKVRAIKLIKYLIAVSLITVMFLIKSTSNFTAAKDFDFIIYLLYILFKLIFIIHT